MTSRTGNEVAVARSRHAVEWNRLRARDSKSGDKEKLRGGWAETPDEGLSFLPHRLLMKLNFQYLNTSALMIFQFYRYGHRMWADENVKWDNRKNPMKWGPPIYYITINQTQNKFERIRWVWFKGTAGLWLPSCNLKTSVRQILDTGRVHVSSCKTAFKREFQQFIHGICFHPKQMPLIWNIAQVLGNMWWFHFL